MQINTRAIFSIRPFRIVCERISEQLNDSGEGSPPFPLLFYNSL